MTVKIFGHEITYNRVTVVVFAIIIIAVFIGVNLFSGVGRAASQEPFKVKQSDVSAKPKDSPSPKSVEENKVKIYICGEVVKPGVYSIVAGSIISDAVWVAGGFTKNAWKGFNLVWEINENVMIRIPSKKNPDKYKIVTVDIQDGGSETGTGVENTEQSSDPGVVKKVNINTANSEQLMELPGVGESTAKKIIEYRKGAKFNTIEEIMNVGGIGEKKYEALKEFIKVK